jgi:4-amino-4-deoxy-L-arabinose transferase-like glycosyltransferase
MDSPLKAATPRTPLLHLGLLISFILIVYAPFLGSRMLRMAGDEKVYVSQALEMAQHGNWFLQRIHEEANYYKGPLHYLLLRAGFLIFGYTTWATLYMNLGFTLLGGLSLAALIRKHFPRWKGGDVWAGSAFALCTGIYTHSFASQMEVELAGTVAFGAFLLDRLKRDEAGYLFWSVTGLIGWMKSPLHSVFLSCSALLFWIFTGELWHRIQQRRSWLALSLGIAIGAVGYLPAATLDTAAFWQTYILRETLSKKGGSGQGWSVAIWSSFGFYLFPWALLAPLTYAQTVLNARALFQNPSFYRCFSLGFSLFIPSALFFCFHPYRFENYNLPVISGVWLWIAAVLGATWSSDQANSLWKTLYKIALGLTGLLLIGVAVAFSYGILHFPPLSAWCLRTCFLLQHSDSSFHQESEF